MSIRTRYLLGLLAAAVAGGVIGYLQGVVEWRSGTLFLVSLGCLVVIQLLAFSGTGPKRPRGLR